MTNRVSYAPQDFRRMCEHAERDHESKRLIILMERVKRQLAQRGAEMESAKRPVMSDSQVLQMSTRSTPFDR